MPLGRQFFLDPDSVPAPVARTLLRFPLNGFKLPEDVPRIRLTVSSRLFRVGEERLFRLPGPFRVGDGPLVRLPGPFRVGDGLLFRFPRLFRVGVGPLSRPPVSFGEGRFLLSLSVFESLPGPFPVVGPLPVSPSKVITWLVVLEVFRELPVR